jgi:ParB family chromosome partitioning protein
MNDLMQPLGLDKLLPPNGGQNPELNQPGDKGRPLLVDIELIDLNPDQPRRQFDDKELATLGQSIKDHGIIEPLVAVATDNGRYELIAGERRLRAAKLIYLKQVPIIIRKNIEDPADRLILALLENLCRTDLNPIEEAESFSRLEKDFGQTHQEIAHLTGRERSSITNSIRLLNLPDYIQDDIRLQRLSAGHGRAVVGLTDKSLTPSLRAEMLAKGLTVRQTEALVRRLNNKKAHASTTSDDQAFYEALAQKFTQQLNGLKVRLNQAGQVKKVEIFYHSLDELEGLMKKLGVEPV